MTPRISIAAFYAFVPVSAEQLPALQAELKQFGAARNMRGLVLLAEEGINGTVCGTPEVIAEWKALITQKFGEMRFNDSAADELVFPRWMVKIREEIVGLKQKDVHPNGEHRHLSPQEWHAMMEQEDVIIIDTRNTYETDIGTFENAVDPRIQTFQEFADYAANANLPKNKKILMCCTGGIRCEKAIIEMEKHGYTDVYQLKGGILSYMREFPEGKFNGECFVFDHRVAVGKNLAPSTRYALCPHCGDPGDQSLSCVQCNNDCKVCARCMKEDHCKTCSKDCRNKFAGKRMAGIA